MKRGKHAHAALNLVAATDLLNGKSVPAPTVTQAPQHFLNFFPLPQGQGSLRPTFGLLRTTGFGRSSAPCAPFVARVLPGAEPITVANGYVVGFRGDCIG